MPEANTGIPRELAKALSCLEALKDVRHEDVKDGAVARLVEAARKALGKLDDETDVARQLDLALGPFGHV